MQLSLGEGIKRLRTLKGYSARHVSLESGLSPSYVSKVEKGEIEPSVSAFYRICNACDATDKEVIILLRLANAYSG